MCRGNGHGLVCSSPSGICANDAQMLWLPVFLLRATEAGKCLRGTANNHHRQSLGGLLEIQNPSPFLEQLQNNYAQYMHPTNWSYTKKSTCAFLQQQLPRVAWLVSLAFRLALVRLFLLQSFTRLAISKAGALSTPRSSIHIQRKCFSCRHLKRIKKTNICESQ